MTTKLIIIGLGNIGRRHLQAISNLDIDYSVLCYDMFQESLDAVAPFCADNNISPKGLEVTNDFSRVLTEIDSDAIVIVATTAKGRADILCDVLTRRPKAVISEKPVSQTSTELDRVNAAALIHSVPVYVNFICHTYDDYQVIFKEIADAKHKYINVNFSNIGFACGGIHYIELATWLMRATSYQIDHARVTSTYEQKRAGFEDFSGNLMFTLNGKHTCTINLMDEQGVDFIEVVTDEKIWKLFETTERKITIDSNYTKEESDFKMRFVSQVTDGVIRSILADEAPIIPMLKQADMAHRILFEFMRRGDIVMMNIT